MPDSLDANETPTPAENPAPAESAPETETAPESATDTKTETPLHRAIGPKLLILFVIGDILGTGIYATTGSVAGKVGGALWLPFVIGFAVALLTAASYAELVGKYPRAAGAALYTQRAFKMPFLTFIIAFMVMCSSRWRDAGGGGRRGPRPPAPRR